MRRTLRMMTLVVLPFVVVAQEENAVKKMSVQQLLAQAQKNEDAGDIKEATRYLNEAAIREWEGKRYEDAISFFNRSIELNKKINNQSGISKINSNLGMIYSDLGQYEKSLAYFQSSLDYRLQNGEKTETISTYINKGVVLNNLKRYSEATKNIESALQLATEMSDAAQMKSCYGMLAETYEKMGDREKTIHYFNLYRTFHEMIQRNKVTDAKKETEAAKLEALREALEKKEKELQLQDTKRELVLTEEQLKEMSAEAKSLFDTNTKQQLAINLLQRENDLNQAKIAQAESKNQLQKIWTALAIVGLMVVFAFAITQYRHHVQKKKINQLLAEQNEEIKVLNENLEGQVQKRTAELQATLLNLEKRNQELDQFSHVISHNLRAPVASILGLSLVINQKDLTDPVNAEVFEKLVQTTRSLDAVVKDLSIILDVKDRHAPEKELVDVSAIIESCRKMVSTEIEKAGAVIQSSIKANVQFKAVKPYLESIVYNLLSNAIKYRSPERPCLVEISARQTSDAFLLEVKDNGTGIHERNLSKIFEPYKRFALDGDGKGLGLYMVKIQVESMKGIVEVESQEGYGSKFLVKLPLN